MRSTITAFTQRPTRAKGTPVRVVTAKRYDVNSLVLYLNSLHEGAGGSGKSIQLILNGDDVTKLREALKE